MALERTDILDATPRISRWSPLTVPVGIQILRERGPPRLLPPPGIYSTRWTQPLSAVPAPKSTRTCPRMSVGAISFSPGPERVSTARISVGGRCWPTEFAWLDGSDCLVFAVASTGLGSDMILPCPQPPGNALKVMTELVRA